MGSFLERRFVNDAELVRENACEAFLTLGGSAPDATVVRGDKYCVCTSPFEHPIANFAIKLNLDADATSEVVARAESHPYFRVHVMSGDTPASAAGALEAAGLKEVYRLSLMAATSGGSKDDRVRVVEGDEIARVVEFVVDQFFWSHPVPFRRQISLVSLRAGDAGRQIFMAIEGAGGLLGAATLFRSEHSVGIYNVCVRASHRGSGIGRALVAHGMALASNLSPNIVLQCDPGLVGWYREFGFSEVGESLTLSAS